MSPRTEGIVNIFQNFMMPRTQVDEFETKGKAILLDRVEGFVQRNEPIDMVMLGFPHKSTNIIDKVLGEKPDLGEELTLKNFATFNNGVKEIYEPGVKIHIASDGFMFNDLLGVSETVVRNYRSISEEMAQEHHAPINWYSLDSFYPTLDEGRVKIMEQFGVSPEFIEAKILSDTDFNWLYNGMIIFMKQELAHKDFVSGNQRQKAAKALTRQMMMRNEAYSNLVKHEFGNMIRISMHNSVNSGAKYSFQLIPGNNTKHSAWHCAILVNDDGTVATLHRIDAQNAGYQLVYQDGRPYYFHS